MVEQDVLKMIETERITARLTHEGDEASILKILEENSDIVRLLSNHPDYAKEAYHMSHYEDLPPGGDKDHLRNLVLFEKASNDLIGVLSCYFGYPKPDIVYIGSLFFRPKWHRKGFGKELMTGIEQILVTAHFHEIRLAVGLKNWPALRFWTGLGYDTVTRISGDTEFGEGKFAYIELTKTIKPLLLLC